MTVLPETPILEPRAAAKAAGLRYSDDNGPGIRREPTDTGFRYLDPAGNLIEDEETLARIRSLAIPPAYTDVWISPRATSHLQATGRDARGRKQYRYHPQWRAFRDEAKFGRMLDFSRALPRIRAQTERDLRRPGMPREKALAAIVRLLEQSLIRVGNEEYASQNQHYGLTTLRSEHVSVEGSTMEFRFVGKSGKEHDIRLRDQQLARIIKRLRDLPGEELFEYLDHDGLAHKITSDDVNGYLHEIAGAEFSAKDFRTWAGTALAVAELTACEACEGKTAAKKNLAEAVKRVSERLGNTPSVCRKCYIHPAAIEGYLGGTLSDDLRRAAESPDLLADLPAAEAALAAWLKGRAAPEKKTRRQQRGQSMPRQGRP